MRLVVFPGTLAKCKYWAGEVVREAAGEFEQPEIYEYLHWGNGDLAADVDAEVQRAKLQMAGWSNYLIIAKSVGVIVSIVGMSQGWLKPAAAVFVGSALHPESRDEYGLDEKISKLEVKMLFIQQTHDPVMPYEKLAKYLKENGASNYQMMEVVGRSHDYEDTALVVRAAADLVG